MTYAEAIKKLRNKMILSQMEFAKLIGVSFAYGNRKNIPMFCLDRVSFR